MEDAKKKKKMLVFMVGLVVAAALALAYFTDWTRGEHDRSPSHQCEEKQCVKDPAPKETMGGADGKVPFFNFRIGIDAVIATTIVFFLIMFILFCCAWYTSNWRLTLLTLVLFFIFCLFMRQFLLST